MSETVKIEPTPIQRNKFDVAMELTQLHFNRFAVNVGDIENLFAKYYALARYCERSEVSDLQKLLSKDLLNVIGKIEPYNSGY